MAKLLVSNIPSKEVVSRLEIDNPWWAQGGTTHKQFQNLPYRLYFERFFKLITDLSVKRALILMGPRRVGKTVILQQSIERLIELGVNRSQILYASVDTPTYTGLSLENLLSLAIERVNLDSAMPAYVFYDEIQYLKDWERHLKVLVDTYSNIRFIASGSAAAALRLKSSESGAGRFTDFMLPPLTFSEYLTFIDRPVSRYKGEIKTAMSNAIEDIELLNKDFIDYINYGGYPEAVFSDTIRSDPGRFIRSDIIDKVLLRDLPSLYGINDIQELNRLFTTIAFQSGQEISLDGLSQSAGVAKNTIKRYLEYLEAAFLIIKLRRIDDNCNRFQRERSFKVYLANPSMRAALFAPITNQDAPELPPLVETAIISQILHSPEMMDIHSYARWKNGEVDLIFSDKVNMKPIQVVEIKWSDRVVESFNDLANVQYFCGRHKLASAIITTRTISAVKHLQTKITFIPCSVFCLFFGDIYSGLLV